MKTTREKKQSVCTLWPEELPSKWPYDSQLLNWWPDDSTTDDLMTLNWWPDDSPVDSLIGAISPVGVAGHVAGEDVITKEVAKVQISSSYSAQTQAGTQHILLKWQKKVSIRVMWSVSTNPPTWVTFSELARFGLNLSPASSLEYWRSGEGAEMGSTGGLTCNNCFIM